MRLVQQGGRKIDGVNLLFEVERVFNPEGGEGGMPREIGHPLESWNLIFSV